MPFLPNFREKFFKGDLIYGLRDNRWDYLHNNPRFKDAKAHYIEGQYPPTLIDNYLIPVELNYKKEFLKEYNKKIINGVDYNDQDDAEMMEIFSAQYNYTKSDMYKKYERSFFSHLKGHKRYHAVFGNSKDKDKDKDKDKEPEYNELTVGRKCKGGLSWVGIGDTKLSRDTHIHFILDDIDLSKVVNKCNEYNERDDSITGKELRWIYRNRNKSNVARKIQFWKDGKPTCPPWLEVETGKDLWKDYVYKDKNTAQDEDMVVEFSWLFNSP